MRPADALPETWVDKAPSWLEPMLRLSRFDRPIGFWLLAVPCWIGMAFARMDQGADLSGTYWSNLLLAAAFGVGSVAMRGAGCTWNDILDRDFDAQVARTAGRPIPAGRISVKGALIWLAVQCLVGLAVLLVLPRFAQIVALCAIPMVLLYPLMKRITWWPQVWLGLTLNWGALVGPAAIRGHLTLADGLLFVGLMFWTLGYDTIYALQDRDDDALIGVKSTARLFGDQSRPAIFVIYALSVAFASVSVYMTHVVLGWLGVALFGGHLLLQAVRLKPDDGANTLNLFRSNRDAALLLLGGWLGAIMIAQGI